MKYKNLKELIADTENRKAAVEKDYRAFDYYDNENVCVIHCKFGRMKKGYSGLEVENGLTQEFVDKFQLFWADEEGGFNSPLEVIEYVIDHNLPVLFYNNFTDEEMTLEEVTRYFDER